MVTEENTLISGEEDKLEETSDRRMMEDTPKLSNDELNGEEECSKLNPNNADDVQIGSLSQAHCDPAVMACEEDQPNKQHLSNDEENVQSKPLTPKSDLVHDIEMNKTKEPIEVLHKQIKKLKEEIHEKKETQKAAEAALEHLNKAYAEADYKVQELTLKLSEARVNMEKEMKDRDDKYIELDTKFQRLHKRAKLRIQDLQKEKDDIEAQLNNANAKAEQASSQNVLVQQELERARQHASEALRSLDAERQQLRVANNKLRDSIDEMRRALESKDSVIEKLQDNVLVKDQMLEKLQDSLKTAEEKKHTSIVELSNKHQKHLESLEGQLSDILAERNKAAETISSLQILLAEKDKEIAEIEAASTGEAVRLGAAIEEIKGELNHMKDQHEKEQQSWEEICRSLRVKLEASESAYLRAEIEFAKVRSKLEGQLLTQQQVIETKDTELLSLKDVISRLESEFSAYKIRAHALLQKKDAEIAAARNTDLVKVHEETLREAERELSAAAMERDKAIRDLQDTLTRHDEEISARDLALAEVEKQVKNISSKLVSINDQYMSEKESWLKDLANLEETWKLKCQSLEARNSSRNEDEIQKNLEELRLKYKKLKEEHESFRDIADRTIEEKENEIAKVLEENKNLLRSLNSRTTFNHIDREISVSAISKQDSQSLSVAAAEQQILLLARQQAQREEELARSQRHILALQQEIEELEHENRLHSQQEEMLKSELRNMERSQKREGIDMTYLKNVVLKLLQTGEVEALLPVVATLLQFSPDEIKNCQQIYSFKG